MRRCCNLDNKKMSKKAVQCFNKDTKTRVVVKIDKDEIDPSKYYVDGLRKAIAVELQSLGSKEDLSTIKIFGCTPGKTPPECCAELPEDELPEGVVTFFFEVPPVPCVPTPTSEGIHVGLHGIGRFPEEHPQRQSTTKSASSGITISLSCFVTELSELLTVGYFVHRVDTCAYDEALRAKIDDVLTMKFLPQDRISTKWIINKGRTGVLVRMTNADGENKATLLRQSLECLGPEYSVSHTKSELPPVEHVAGLKHHKKGESIKPRDTVGSGKTN